MNPTTNNVAFKIAMPVILAGLFVVVAIWALNPTGADIGFYIVVAFIFLFVFFYGVAAGQKAAQPVKKLLKRALELTGGDLTTRVYLESKDEFEELAKLFNKIAEELEKSRQNEVATEKSVGIKVKAKTQSLEETINALEHKVQNRTAELERLMGDSEKMREAAKSREAETQELKREIETLKTQLGGRKKKAAKTVKE